MTDVSKVILNVIDPPLNNVQNDVKNDDNSTKASHKQVVDVPGDSLSKQFFETHLHIFIFQCFASRSYWPWQSLWYFV